MVLRPDSCMQVSRVRADNVHVCERCPDDEVLGAGGNIEETSHISATLHHSAAPIHGFLHLSSTTHTHTEIQQVYSVPQLHTQEN